MKMRTHQPQTVRHSKSSPKREVHSTIGLPQEARKISNKQSDPTPKRTRKTPKKAQHKQKERKNKNQSRNKQNRV